MSKSSIKTHFGYQEIAEHEKSAKVAEVFSSVASRYDLMNDLMSFGVHRVWKKIAIEICQAKEGQIILDLAGGTGDLTKQFAKKIGQAGRVILSDINQEMLNEGRDRLIDEGLFNNISYARADAESLPFADNSFDTVIIAFGLRNVTHIDKALSSIYRILKPAGKIIILEFSQVQSPILKSLYDNFSFNIIPKMGKWVTNDEASYQYLVESIRMHPNQETLKQMMIEAGFEQCSYMNLTGGIVAIHKGVKY